LRTAILRLPLPLPLLVRLMIKRTNKASTPVNSRPTVLRTNSTAFAQEGVHVNDVSMQKLSSLLSNHVKCKVFQFENIFVLCSSLYTLAYLYKVVPFLRRSLLVQHPIAEIILRETLDEFQGRLQIGGRMITNFRYDTIRYLQYTI